ncbi:hypothetical protein ACFQ9X_14015 [Catenulispora yoronensis]
MGVDQNPAAVGELFETVTVLMMRHVRPPTASASPPPPRSAPCNDADRAASPNWRPPKA